MITIAPQDTVHYYSIDPWGWNAPSMLCTTGDLGDRSFEYSGSWGGIDAFDSAGVMRNHRLGSCRLWGLRIGCGAIWAH